MCGVSPYLPDTPEINVKSTAARGIGPHRTWQGNITSHGSLGGLWSQVVS